MLALGIPSMDELFARMPNQEDLSLWMAFYQIEPFGPTHDEERLGKVATFLKGGGHWGDIFPGFQDEHKPIRIAQSAAPVVTDMDQHIEQMKAYTAALNGANQKRASKLT